MSKDNLEHLLQKCLEGYDAGLSPEECLSAYPRARARLEPLLRHALSLRVAYAAAPREEFKYSARERLLFAAGRDVSKALDSTPDPSFVNLARSRFLRAAGSPAQEALRDVPPPRLPFWANARRHLLDAANRPAASTPGRSFAFPLRSAISAAVVVFAVAIAGLAFMMQTNPANDTRSASANLEYLEQELDNLELASARGEDVSARLAEISQLTFELMGQLEQSEETNLIERLPELIERQRSAVDEAVTSGDNQPELAAAQQQLIEAEQRLAAASTSATPSDTTALSEPTEEPTESPTPQATPVPPNPPQQPDDLQGNEVLVQFDPTDNTLGMRWTRVTTSNITFVIGSNWNLPNIRQDEQGRAFTDTSKFAFLTNGAETHAIVIDGITGEVVLVDEPQIQLRRPGPDGQIISTALLFDLIGGESAALVHFLDSVELRGPPAATPEPVDQTEESDTTQTTESTTETDSSEPTATP